MSTEKVKVCPKCGWVYPATSKNYTCFICGTQFTEGYCAICGEHTTDLIYGKYCKPCFYKYKGTPSARRCMQRVYAQYDEIYTTWLDKIQKAPVQPLTEVQWLEVCRYFGGCAYCGAESIDARSYFIPFKNGGRYCAWNIVPACERCAAASESKQPDPFRRLINQARRDNMKRIIEYLEVRLDAAVAGTTGSSEQYHDENHRGRPGTE